MSWKLLMSWDMICSLGLPMSNGQHLQSLIPLHKQQHVFPKVIREFRQRGNARAHRKDSFIRSVCRLCLHVFLLVIAVIMGTTECLPMLKMKHLLRAGEVHPQGLSFCHMLWGLILTEYFTDIMTNAADPNELLSITNKPVHKTKCTSLPPSSASD